MGTESWTTAYSETRYYNLDLENGKLFTLADVLGADYKQIADEEIRRQMRERADSGSVYFEGFEGIDENTPFYLNENGNPVIVFDKYEIAPGARGNRNLRFRKQENHLKLKKWGLMNYLLFWEKRIAIQQIFSVEARKTGRRIIHFTLAEIIRFPSLEVHAKFFNLWE